MIISGGNFREKGGHAYLYLLLLCLSLYTGMNIINGQSGLAVALLWIQPLAISRDGEFSIERTIQMSWTDARNT